MAIKRSSVLGRVLNKNKSKKEEKSTSTTSKNFTPAPVFSGPVKPGTSESTFRSSGTSVQTFTPSPKVFSSGGGGGGGGGGSSSFTPAPNQSISPVTLQSTPAPNQSRPLPNQSKPTNGITNLNTIRQNRIKQFIKQKANISSKNFQSNLQRLQSTRERLRGQRSSTLLKPQTKKEKFFREVKLLGATSAQTVGENLFAIISLPRAIPSLAKQIKENPKIIVDVAKNTPKKVANSIKEGIELARVSPTEVIAKVGTELILLKGTSQGLKITGKISKKASTRLNPKFTKFEKGTINIKSITGNTIKLQEGTVSSGSKTLSKQTQLAGKNIPISTSVQSDKIVGSLLSREKIIRKPLPGEDKLSKSTKNLIKKFDDGTITNKEFIILNKKLRKESKNIVGMPRDILERSLFASPGTTIRTSRLPKEVPDAKLKDILRGDFTLRSKSSKPQILIFEGENVQKFPKSLKDIQNKLKQNKQLTEKEKIRLVKFQTEKSGKFKPIGDTIYAGGKESEITIAPGEIVKRLKKIGVTEINGKKVEIIRAKIVKPSKETSKLLKKFKNSKLNQKELRKLNKLLKKETGFKVNLKKRTTLTRRRLNTQKKPLRIGRRTTALLSRTLRNKKRTPSRKRPTPRSTPRKRPTPRSTPRKRPTPRSTPRKRPTPRSPPRKRPTPISTKKIRPLIRIKRKKLSIKTKKKNTGYDVFAKPVKGKRLIKVNKSSLTKKRAEDLRNYILDTSLARTGKIKSNKIKPSKPVLKFPSGYSSKTSNKFRKVRIKDGKARKLSRGKVIEKTRNILDTRQEKNKISLARRIKQITPKKRVKRKVIKKKRK